MYFRIFMAVVTVSMALGFSRAIAEEAVPAAVIEKLRATLGASSTGLKIGSVKASEFPGLFEVQVVNGPVLYASPKGDYFIVGDIFSVGPAGYVNLAEKRRDAERLETLATVDVDDMIVFSPQGTRRGTVTVFTDVSCYYCQKLHKEVPELNKRGIEVRYLAYPRAGLESQAYRQLASAWCADDKQNTLTRLKNKETVADNVCADNPVAAQYALGQKMGVRGTPAMVTDTGKMIPGYQSAEELTATLGLN